MQPLSAPPVWGRAPDPQVPQMGKGGAHLGFRRRLTRQLGLGRGCFRLPQLQEPVLPGEFAPVGMAGKGPSEVRGTGQGGEGGRRRSLDQRLHGRKGRLLCPMSQPT